MEFSFQHERKGMKRLTKLEDVKRSVPKPKPKPKSSVELPFDVMVSILTRLPARHLRRMRSVCRSWSLLISDSHFIKEYSKFRASVTKKPYIASLHRISLWQSGYKMTLFPDGDDGHSEFDMCMDSGSQYCTISNSCDGLICVVSHTITYLVNPSIQKKRALMRRPWDSYMPNIHSAGLGFNDSTGEYKVVRFLYNKVGELGCEVHTVGNLHSPSSWKAIDSPPLEPSSDSLPVFVNSAIHWTVSDHPDEVPPEIALSFDVKSEKFDLILHPEGSSRPPRSRVVELGGLVSLACTHPDGVRMDIWVLKDYNNRKWIKQYSIDLSTMCCWKSLAFLTIPVTIHGGKIVFCNCYGGRDYYDLQSKIFVKHTCSWGRDYYDLQSKSFVHRERFFTGFVDDTAYAESIVWPLAPTFFSDTT